MKTNNSDFSFHVRSSDPNVLAKKKQEAMSFHDYMKKLQAKSPEYFSEHEVFKISTELKKIEHINPDQKFEIVKFCAEKNGYATAEHFKLFEIDNPDKTFEIARVCFENDGMTSEYLKNFEINDHEKNFELAKICAHKSDDGKLGKYFADFKINDSDRRYEIAMICAQRGAKNLSKYFKNFKIDNSDKIFEIAKIHALENGSGAARYFKNFGINDPDKIIQIAKLCAEKDGELAAEYFKNFRISDPDKKFEIAKFYAEKNMKSITKYFKKFEINDPGQTFEILKICAQKDSSETVLNIEKFINFNNDQKFEIAKICALKNARITAQYFKTFKITDHHLRFEIAKICAQQDSIETCRVFSEFEIDDRESVLKIAKFRVLDKNPPSSTNFLRAFLFRNSPLTPQDKLNILLLCDSFYGINSSDFDFSFHSSWQTPLVWDWRNLSDPTLRSVIKKCSDSFSQCIEAREPQKAIQLLRECCTNDLPCSVGGGTADMKGKALQNQSLFVELLIEIERYQDKHGDTNATEEMQLHQCRWMSNLFLRLTLDRVSIETVHQLRPLIRAISGYRDRDQRCFLNTLLCQDVTQLPQSWTEKFAADATTTSSQVLASFLLSRLDPKDQTKLQASITSTPAKAVFKNGDSLRHYADACIVLAETADLDADEQLAVLIRLDQAARKQTEQDIAALQGQYSSTKLEQSLREDWVTQLQEGAVAKVQKNLYFQVLKQCLKDKALLPDANKFPDERKALSQKLSALSTSFSLEKFQENHFSQAYLSELLPSLGSDVDDKALLAALRKLIQQTVESQLGDLVSVGEPRPDKITRDQIAASIATHVLSWYNKVAGENQAERQENFNAGVASQKEGIFVRNLLKELSLFQTLLELGSIPAGKDLLKEAHLSPLDLLLPILQNRLRLTETLDVVKFLEVMAAWRDPDALFTYAGRVGNYVDACEGLGRFAVSLTEGTFAGQRYAQDNLDATFAKLPKAIQEKWCDSAPFEAPLEQMLRTGPGAASPALGKSLHDTCFNLFKENLSTHGHLGIKGEALWTSFPLFAKYFYGPSSATQNIKGLLQQAEQDSADYEENRKQNQFQTALIQFIEQPDSLALLEAVQDSLTALGRDCELVRDLSGWKTSLLDRQNTVKKFDGWKVMVTDNPQLLFSMGEDVAGSCQSYAGTPELCRGLIGTVWDPKAKLVAITNGSGKIVGRCIVRTTLDPNGKPVLLMEQQYPAVLTPPELGQSLKDQAIAYARMLGCDLVTTQITKDAEAFKERLVFGKRKYEAYIDSLKGNTAGDELEHLINACFLYQHKEPLAVGQLI